MATQRFSLGIDQDLYDWLEGQIKSGVFYSRRHGIEFALTRLKRSWEKNERELEKIRIRAVPIDGVIGADLKKLPTPSKEVREP